MAYAKQSYKPGDVIYVGEPLVHAHHRSVQGTICANCSARHDLKFCKGCEIVKYCSRQCQRNDWKSHKLECLYLKNLTTGSADNVVHLLGKLILKIQGRSWKTIIEKVNGTIVSFADMSYREDAIQDPETMLFYQEVKARLINFIGKENVPGDEELFQIIAKATYTNIFLCGSVETPELSAFYMGSSVFDHACIPNAKLNFRGKTLLVRATKRISLTEKITTSYFPMVCTKESVQKSREMRKPFLGPCKCEDCSLPYGTSLLTKIIDEKRAYSIIQETKDIIGMVEATLPFRIRLPIRDHIKNLMKKQEGVLGDTNVLRMRLLALKCMHLKGPPEEVREELKQLESYMRLVFGKCSEELNAVYSHLAECNMVLGFVDESVHYAQKVASERIGFPVPGDILNFFTFKAFVAHLNPFFP